MEYDFSKIVISTAPAFEDFDLINGDLATLEIVEKSGGGNCFVTHHDVN